MKYKIAIVLLFTIMMNTIDAQPLCTFRTYKKILDTIYAQHVPILNPNDGMFLIPNILMPYTHTNVSPRMDIYIPDSIENDVTNKTFPLIIIAHGAKSSKSAPIYKYLADEFVKRGFVVANIDYRFDARYKSSWVNVFTNLDISKTADSVNGTLYNSRYSNRELFSNTMDVTLALKFLINNSTRFNIDTSKIILGGLSLGGGTTLSKIYASKHDYMPYFSTIFLTDTNYIDISKYNSNIKSAFAYMGGITDLNFINCDENKPLFLYHGTHDYLVPYYNAPLLCEPYQTKSFGSAAIVERLDSIGLYKPNSYYFIEARGVGHSVLLTNDLANLNINSGILQLHIPDLMRFLYNSIYNTYKNKVHKIITPHNGCLSYCNSNYFNRYINDGALFDDISSSNNKLCSEIPVLSLNTKPWNDIIPASCNDFFPQILKNCNSNITCTPQNIDSIIVFPIDTTVNDTTINDTTITDTTITSIIDNHFYLDIVVYPNPTKDNLFLESKELINIKDIEMYTLDGRNIEIKINKIDQYKYCIFINNFDNGIYFIKMKYNNTIHTRKIILQK